MIDRICIDMDDVLNKFTQTAMRKVGFKDWTPNDHKTLGEFDIVKSANAMGGNFTPASFWKLITRDVWATVPKSAEYELILNYAVTLVGHKNIIVLTAPTIDPECLAGKLEWIHAVLPKWLHRQFLIGPVKHFCARPGTLLIDDADRNIDGFRLHGGEGLLVPRPWNTLHGHNTLNHLRVTLQGYVDEREAERRTELSGLDGDSLRSLRNLLL
jgi:5'(3')-deoxyribonucleotidase